ncbi:cytoskeleton-associated protein 2-like [Caloenas nicobarica]|uniref:cytoskeleton-associated protein 2-like n=1 Tax=Caloenas nicobarica TaxID=187106 RepID=UPI0032B80891
MERAGAAEEQRRWLQQNRAAQENLKCSSAKLFLKDQTNRLSQPSEPVSKLEQVDRKKKDIPKNAEKSAQGDGKLGAKSTEHTGHATRHKSLETTQRAAVLRPKQPTSGAVTGPRDRIKSRQAEEKPIQGKIWKNVPGSKSASQKPSVETHPLQPSRFFTASTNLLHKKPGANQEKTDTARKPLGVVPGAALKNSSRPPQLQRSPPKLPASSRPQGTLNPKSSLQAGGTVRWQNPAVKGGADRKEAKVAPPRHVAVSRVPVPQNRPRSTHGSETPAINSNFRSRREGFKPRLPWASGVQNGRVPKTPRAANRRKELEAWVAAKGRVYKRPPMVMLQKTAVKLPCRNVKEKEKQEQLEKQEELEQLSLEKINNILTECLKRVEEGGQEEEVSAMLSQVPQAEKFAKFWICKAKLLTQSGPLDVKELYNAAAGAGAVPIQELKEFIFDVLMAGYQTLEGENTEQPVPWEPKTPCPSKRQHVEVTPCMAAGSRTLPSSIKLLIKSASRAKELLEGQEVKLVTPVRRSQRIEWGWSCYPEVLQEHDTVVSSLSEILEAEEETRFFFRKNKALPEVPELEDLSLYPPEQR